MTQKPKRPDSKRNPSSRDETRNCIKRQTEDFLKLGGVIQCIPNGVSGQIWKPNKHTKTQHK